MCQPCAKRPRIDNDIHIIQSEIIHSEMECSEVDMDFCQSDYWDSYMEEDMSIKWSELSYSEQPTKCVMCESYDHLVSSCPHTCCLTCGKETDNFIEECVQCIEASTICEICGYRGHTKYNCPYVWKYDHSTVSCFQIPNMQALMYSKADSFCDLYFLYNDIMPDYTYTNIF